MIVIQPANPTSDTTITFTFAGSSPCPTTERTIEGSTFIFEVRDDDQGPCFSTPIPYELAWEVGVLDSGEYQVIHLDPRAQPETQGFVVIQGVGPSPEPVPAVDPIGTVLLLAVVALIAMKSLQRAK